MEAGAAPEDTSISLQCPVCAGHFQEPRLLPCFHCLCSRCLLEKLARGDFPCPVCNTKVVCLSDGTNAFPVDVYVETELLKREGDINALCDACQERTVACKCMECRQFLCEGCSMVHSRLNATRSHTLLTLASLSNSARAQALVQDRVCSIHPGERLRFFCHHCVTLVCRDCKLTAHQPHPTVDLRPLSADMMKSLCKISGMSRDGLQPSLEEALQVAEHHRETLAASALTLLREVRDRASEVKAAVDRHVESVEKQVEAQRGQLEATLLAMRSVVHALLRMRTHLDHRCQQVQGGDADIIALFLHLQHCFGARSGDGDVKDDPGNMFTDFVKERWRHTLKLHSPASGSVEGGLQAAAQSLPGSDVSACMASVVQYIGTVQQVQPVKTMPAAVKEPVMPAKKSASSTLSKGATSGFTFGPSTELSERYMFGSQAQPTEDRSNLLQKIEQELDKIRSTLTISSVKQ